MNLSNTVSQNTFTGTGAGISFYEIVSNTSITDLDGRNMNVAGNSITISGQANNLTIARLKLAGPRPLICNLIQNSLFEDIEAPGPGGNGLYFRNSTEVTIRNCNFSGRGSGIYLHYDVPSILSGGNRVEGNILTDCKAGYPNSGVWGQGRPSESADIFFNNNCSRSGTGIETWWASEISGNTLHECNIGLHLWSSSDAKVYHNNIFECTGRNVHAEEPIVLSYNEEGNYWDYTCPGPLFEPGVDSNSPDVVDSYPYGLEDGWLDPQVTPGCPPIKNQSPLAEAGGPYSVNEGGSVEVTGSGSDPDDDQLTFAWDLDNDGTFEIEGQQVIFSAAELDGPSSKTIVLRVTDSGGLFATDQAIVNILNVAPTVEAINAPIDPVQVSTEINANAIFSDPGVLDNHTATWDWGDESTSEGSIDEANGSGTVTGSHIYTAAGVYTVLLTVNDDNGGSGQTAFLYIVVFDPNAGFVTGGGWINSPEGAYVPDPSLTGKANFGFVSKYKKGQSTPDGNTQFHFKVADLNFSSVSYDWLVIAGPNAKYKGNGTINNNGNYGFMLTAVDGQIIGGDGVDKFRMKIWDKDSNDEVIYDNQMGDPDDGDATDAIDGGSIVIHKEAGLQKSGDFVEDTESEALPRQFSLAQNHPNPFNPTTTINYSLAEDSHVKIIIYNTLGQVIDILMDGQKSKGYHAVIWNAKNQPSGLYICRFEAEGFTGAIKMFLQK